MSLCIFKAGILAAAGLGVAAGIFAQVQPTGSPAQSTQNPQPAKPLQPAQPPAESSGNPFPGDITTVPVMPSSSTAAVPDAAGGEAMGRIRLPALDVDPARSPDDADSAPPPEAGSESSSSVPELDRIEPKDTEDTKKKGKGKDAPEYHETAASDIDVGNFELERKNWRGALSRFQSAMVLDPENPDAFFGMAEAARHLGDFASARGYYQRVVDYDPESRHGKEARKALKDPQIANAQSAAKSQPAQQQQ